MCECNSISWRKLSEPSSINHYKHHRTAATKWKMEPSSTKRLTDHLTCLTDHLACLTDHLTCLTDHLTCLTDQRKME